VVPTALLATSAYFDVELFDSSNGSAPVHALRVPPRIDHVEVGRSQGFPATGTPPYIGHGWDDPSPTSFAITGAGFTSSTAVHVNGASLQHAGSTTTEIDGGVRVSRDDVTLSLSIPIPNRTVTNDATVNFPVDIHEQSHFLCGGGYVTISCPLGHAAYCCTTGSHPVPACR
jgi:hypothetical protein